jgi:pimeloyl-ACP methyl ester carboxylesterase
VGGGERMEARGRAHQPAESLRCIADDVTHGVIAECGHFIPEEQPAALAERLLSFLSHISD